MDKTKVTMRKGSKPKNKKESPEVFVIPPNLLEKLGIHLGNLGSAPESTLGSLVTDSNLISKENTSGVNKTTCKNSRVGTSSENQSSIIETAELMKKSVFLSPTFISNNTSIIQGEVEIVGNAEAECIDMSDRLLKNECSTKTTVEPPIETHKEQGSVCHVETSSNNQICLFTQENLHHDQIPNDHADMNNTPMETLLDDHADEAYSSDCSNSNMGCPVKSKLKTNQNKINIISEQIILPSQFNKLKNNYSPRENSLIPVSINTNIIDRSYIQSNTNKNQLNLIPNVVLEKIVPTVITVVSKDDMHAQLFIEAESNLRMEDNETIDNINKIDICGALNEAETELIITTQNQEYFQQDLEALPSPHKDDLTTKDDTVEDTVLGEPCLIDVDNVSNATNKRHNDYSTNTHKYSEQSNNVVKTVEMNQPDETKGDNFISETVSRENNSDTLVDEKDSSTSYIIEPANGSKNRAENKYMEVDLPTEYITADRYTCHGVLPSNNDFKTLEKNLIEEPNTLQNCETDLIKQEKGISTPENKDIDLHGLENTCKSVIKAQCSGDTSQMEQHKNAPKLSESPIFYVKYHKKPVHEKHEISEDQCKQQDVQNSEPRESKISDCKSFESKKFTAERINKAAVIQEDKVREIAKYLSEFADIKKRSHFIKRHVTTTSKTPSNKKGATSSKSSIQGVEKPGGSEQHEKHYPPTKTYGRRVHSRKTIPSYVLKESASIESINLTDSGFSNNFCYDFEECLCYDFGQLKSYDDVSSYEHIHFWNKVKTDYSPEIVFSIYNEDAAGAAVDCEQMNVVYECPNEISETPNKLCWNELKLIYDNSFDENDLRQETDLIKNSLFTENNISACADSSNVENMECNEKKEAKKGGACKKSVMINVSSMQKCEGIPNKEIVIDDHAAKTQKRKLSDDGETPSKNIKRSIPNRLSQTKEKHDFIDEESTTSTSEKPTPKNASPLKASCASSSDNATFSSKTSTKSKECSFHDVVLSEQNQPGTCIPVNESASKRFDQPSTSLKSPEPRTEKSEEVVITNQHFGNENNAITCGVCQQNVEGADWINHIASQHQYLAWKCGEPSLDVDDETAIREHLYGITKVCGGLTCANCGLTRKYVKAYLSHVRDCTGLIEKSSEVTSIVKTEHISVKNEVPVNDDLVKCGVCEESIQNTDWNYHRGSRHDYLSWKFGDPPLDVNNEAAVRDHLYEITKACGGLTCAKCGLTRKYVKAYLSHIRSCNGLSESQNDSAYYFSSEIIPEVQSPVLTVNAIGENDTASANTRSIKCGVCHESVELKDWIHHIASQHDYLAWKLGDEPLNINDEAAVRDHLYEITKTCSGLTCAKCGLTRKYVKAYLNHIKNCDGLNESQNDSTYNVSSDKVDLNALNGAMNLSNSEYVEEVTSTALVQCALCEESMQEKFWYSHIAARHDYLAWKLGDTALDLCDENAVREHLYEITKANGGLTCAKCGLTRKYVKAYLSHVKHCNGPDSSRNDSVCNISADASLGMGFVGLPDDSISKVKQENAPKKAVMVTCAVCEESVQEMDWYIHIGSRHDYLAWKSDESSLDVYDESAVHNHLYIITKACGGLKCSKCGLSRKYVKAYLSHFKNCNGLNESQNDNLMSTDVSGVDSAESANSSRKEANDELEVKCALCAQYVLETNWNSHIASQHGYLAWKEGEKCLNLDNEKEVREHLRTIVREMGVLKCPECDVPHTNVKNYLNHVEICRQRQEDMNNAFKCGVCKEMIKQLYWEKHLSEKHEYLAWKDGDTPVDLDNEEAVYEHLYKLSKQFERLLCNNCGLKRKYVKSYLEHIKICKSNIIPEGAPDETSEASVFDFTSGGTCAVCHKEIEPSKWIQHTQKEHNYLAWREGETPWNLDDFDDLNQYLYVICKKLEGLTCNKCGIVRKYVKTYLTHIKSCDVVDFNLNSSVAEGVGPLNTDKIQCAMCKEQMKLSDWKNHAMSKHYNISWIIGETPIDIKNPYAVERYLKEYKQVYGRLECNGCKTSRASFAGFYAHIIVCGKSEEEIDLFRSVCDICNNKYLCIYKNQHAMIHKVQEYTAVQKMKKVENSLKLNEELNRELSGKRRAALKARTVIENYSDNMSKYAHSCQSCGFGTDFQDELNTHKCEVSNEKDFSGDISAAEIESSDESVDTDVDSNISNEVNGNEVDDDDDEDEAGLEVKKKFRHREPAPVLSKVSRIPFTVDDPTSYLRQGDEDYINTFLTDEILFPQWQCQLEPVLESEITRYLPPLMQSCKFKCHSSWKILSRFEAQKDGDVTCLFVGASIVCVAWVPLRVEHLCQGSTNFLAVACHNGPDCPRYEGAETPKHENLIQIWNFSKFERLPRLVLGIAHDFGTVWSMDWCPSGARDIPLDDEEANRRLGLLAVACSSGSAYIFAVPYPPSYVNYSQFVHKLKPVAELRMTMGSERKRYQATSVSWSKQKGHTTVLVGYADGSTAYYDLHSTSPLLLTIENDIQVFHPYNDERPHNTCITGTDLYPAAGDSAGSGAGVWTAPTGAELAARAGAGACGRARLATSSLAVEFAPHACCAVLGGDDAIMYTAISELAWVPPGRRLGGIRATAGCARCARLVASVPPVLRVMRPHPAYWDAKKQVVGLLEMTHLAKKRKKQVNDELAMVVEPLTYDDAILKYGITFKKIGKTDKETQQACSAKPKAHCPERFPLADVKSMAFCPSRRHHEKLVVATHSGIIFLTTVQ